MSPSASSADDMVKCDRDLYCPQASSALEFAVSRRSKPPRLGQRSCFLVGGVIHLPK